MAATRGEPRHRAVAAIPESLLAELLSLPTDIRVHAVYVDNLRATILVHLEGGDLPLCEEASYPEQVWLAIETQIATDGGRPWMRLKLER